MPTPLRPQALPTLPRRQFLAGLAAVGGVGGAGGVASLSGMQPAWAGPSGDTPPLGIAVPIGGALRFDNAAVWQRLVSLAGGPGARFAVLATASGQPERAAQAVLRTLRLHGAQGEHIAVSPRLPGTDLAKAVREPRWVDSVLASQAVFFCGGAQERIVDTLWPAGVASPLLEAIWQVFRRGGMVAGTSAGAAVMSSTMFRDAPSVMRVLKGELREGREMGPGLGFVGPALFVDQHFFKRGRVGRLLPLMLQKGYILGLGVEENTAAIVQGDTVEVVGARSALLVDLRDAEGSGGRHARPDASVGAGATAANRSSASNSASGATAAHEGSAAAATHAPPRSPFRLQGARLSLLDSGDRYDLASRRFQPSATKRAEATLDATAAGFNPSFDDRPFHLDILGENTLAQAMCHLIDNTAHETRGLAFDAAPMPDDPAPQLGFEFRLYKDADSRGWSTGVSGSEETSVAHLRLDVTPVRVAQPLYRPWGP